MALIGFLAEHNVTEVLMTPSLADNTLAIGGQHALKATALQRVWLNGEALTKVCCLNECVV